MKTRTQKRAFILSKRLLSSAIIGVALSMSIGATAQPFGPNCTTTQIDISTGLDNTGSVIPYPTSGSTQDPYWTVTMVPTNTLGLSPDFCAEVVDNTTATSGSMLGPYTVSGAAYISFATTPTVANLGAGCGFFWTYHHGTIPPGPISGANPVRFTREFYIEGSTSRQVTIDLNGYGDDIIFVAVDATPGTPIFNNPSNPNNVYYNASTSTTTSQMSVSGYTITLSPGAHTIDVDLYDISGVVTAVSLHGTISIDDPYLADNLCYGQNDCGDDPPPTCDDECYWTVHGNNIQNFRNNFGTTSDDDVNIITNNWMRGIFTTGAQDIGSSFFGWNTMHPTSILHVNCEGNHDDGSGLSDIRFENLEHGTGNVLVIDDDGHVFRTDYNIEDIVGGGADAKPSEDMTKMYQEVKDQNDQLQQQLNSMKARLDAMENCCASKGGYSDASTTNNTGSALYQNTPNPFSNETTVEYYVHTMKSNAYIVLYDLNGRELNRYAISETGKGYVTVNSDKMVAGMYLYSLVIDGREIDSKKMVLSKSH